MDMKRILPTIFLLGYCTAKFFVVLKPEKDEVFSTVGKNITVAFNINASGTLDIIEIHLKRSNEEHSIRLGKISFQSGVAETQKHVDYKDRTEIKFEPIKKVSVMIENLQQNEVNSEVKCTISIKEDRFAEVSGKIKITEAVAPVISYSDIFNETHSEKELSTHLKPYVCRATGKPTPRVVWSDDHGAEFGAGNGSADLTINGAFTKEHGGNYFCTATNIAGEAKEKMFIQAVFIKLKDGFQPFAVQQVVDNEIDLRCPIEGVPDMKFYWYHNGKQQPSQQDGKKLLKQNIKDNDLGNYTCVASNEAGDLNYTVEVVMYKARIVDSSSVLTLASSLLTISLHVFCVFLLL